MKARSYISIAVAALSLSATAARAGQTTLTVAAAYDSDTMITYDALSAEVMALNTVGDAQSVTVATAGHWIVGTWPLVPAGVTITSAVVTIQYKMAAPWDSLLWLRVGDATSPPYYALKSDLTESATLATETWDITAAINAQPDPVGAANELRFQFVHWDAAETIDFCHIKVDVQHPAVPPQTPAISSPADDETGVACNPTVTANAFDDDGSHVSSDWRIYGDASLTSLVFSSDGDASNLESIAVQTSNGTFAGSLNGASALAYATEYWTCVRYTDDDGLSSPWSASVRFVTTYEPPQKPSITAPILDETDVSRHPTVTATAFVDNGTHVSSDWELYDDAALGLANLVAYSNTDATNLTSITIEAPNGTYIGSLAGHSGLDYASEYWVRVRYRDDDAVQSAWSDAVRFVTTDTPLEDEVWTYFGEGGCAASPPLAGGVSAVIALLCALTLRRRSA